MTPVRLTLSLFSLFFFLTGCADESQVRQKTFYAFGTQINITLSGVSEQTANGVIDELNTTFDEVNSHWHAWQPSVLTNINAAIAQQKPIAITPETAKVITLAKQLAQQSHHLFNPAAGHLFALWGFHQDDWFQPRPPPKKQAIQHWLDSKPTMEAIHIQAGYLSSDNHMVKLGFGGFAKGYAIEQVIAVLTQYGIHHALVDIGGDLKTIGQRGERPWSVGIRHPRQDGLLATLTTNHNESVFTSGDYERFFTYQQQRYPHILDPNTGYPARQTQSVTVLHPDPSVADAAATALFVAGKQWPKIAVAMGIESVLVVTSKGQIEVSPALLPRLRLTDQAPAPIIRSLGTS